MRSACKFFRLTQNILEISWHEGIDESTLLQMIILKKYLSACMADEILDIRMGYHTIALHFKESDIRPGILAAISRQIEHLSDEKPLARKRWRIPVCYSDEVAKDLSQFTRSKKMSVPELINHHTSGDYVLFFYGFLPGFMYLGGLSDRLQTPRKSVPDPLIEAGSVAIGGQQTGIYPIDSPGGWHVIGKTPFRLFDPAMGQLPPFHPGDSIRFFPVSLAEFTKLSQIPELILEHELI
jgi:KipI family sensor histidine kinase inhibitor